MSLKTWLDHRATYQPKKVFCRHFVRAADAGITETSALTYEELQNQSANLARYILERLDIKKSVVPIFLPQGIECYYAFLGVMLAGGIPTFMPLPSAKQDEARYWASHIQLFDRIRPGLIITSETNHAALCDAFRSIPVMRIDDFSSMGAHQLSLELPLIADQELAFLQHSSGTTGLKKGVAFTHVVLEQQLKSYAGQLEITGNDVIASWLPLYHDMGMISCFMLPLYLGATIATIDPFVWSSDPISILRMIERCRASHCWMPNFAFEHIVRLAGNAGPLDLSSLRSLINCSEPCRSETFARFAKRFGIGLDKLGCTYAMAETVFAVSTTALGAKAKMISLDSNAVRENKVALSADDTSALQLISSGKPLPDVSVSIHDASGQILGENVIGEIAIEAPFLASGYFNNEPETRERFHDGKYFTRDRGFLFDGEVFVLGRLDDVIIVNGRNFNATHIEAVVGQVDGVVPGRCVALAIYNSNSGTNQVVLIAETMNVRDSHPTIIRSVKQAVFEDMDLMLYKTYLVEPGWIIKTTSGKISREANFEKYKTTFLNSA